MPASDHQNAPRPSRRMGFRAVTFRRQNTNDSGHSTARSGRSLSFNVVAERERESVLPKKTQEKYSVYAGLTWEVIREYLHQRWPNEDFKEVRRNDNWVFETPEPLTEDDRAALAELRDRNSDKMRGQRDAVTPEP